jgi:hypothetical protein
MYLFLACNEKLASFQEALEDEKIKSYNELLKMGMTEQQIQLRGHDFSKIDRDAKVFLIMLPDEIANSPLSIEPDFKNSYARFLTDKRYIYKVEMAHKALLHFAGYIGKYSDRWRELEIWHVEEDDYNVDSTTIVQKSVHLRQLTNEHLEDLVEATEPKMLRLLP